MAEFVVYHSPVRMGYSANTVPGFSILTNRNVPSVVGSRVWLLTGAGTPRTYYLRGHFTPTRRTRTEESGFVWLVEGPRSSGTAESLIDGLTSRLSSGRLHPFLETKPGLRVQTLLYVYS